MSIVLYVLCISGYITGTGTGEWLGRKNPANLRVSSLSFLVASSFLYGPRPTGVVLDSNRPVFGLLFSISSRLSLLFRPQLIAVAVFLIATTSAPASIVRYADSQDSAASQRFEATADVFKDTVNLVYFDRVTVFLSGIAAATVWENTEAIFAPLRDTAGREQSATSFAKEAAAARDRLRNAQLAALAQIQRIGLGALGCWILSFAAWQIRDTSPRRILR